MRNFLKQEEASKLLGVIEDPRDRLYVALGLYLGPRHSETATIRWADILNELGQPVSKFKLYAKKQKKMREILVPDAMKEVILSCYGDQPMNHLCCPSKWRGYISGKDTLTSQAGRDLLAKYYKKAGIKNVQAGTHVLRRTFGRRFYQSNGATPHALIMLQKYFEHSSVEQTMQYIGLTQEELAEMAGKVSYELNPNTAAVQFLSSNSAMDLALFLKEVDIPVDIPELLNDYAQKKGRSYNFDFLCS